MKLNFSVIALDIDHFKKINDTYGHDVGDEVIKLLAQQIRAGSRESDILCRNGGEELPGTSQMAERLRQSVEGMQIPQSDKITISLGIADDSSLKIQYERVLKKTDEALYRAKQEGRNRVVVSP
ncbi:GGDEF domain-containing protein [Ewingella sp. S1.OA.A_B6]